ncbi:MAG: hypothetical protein QXY26_09535 [Ignisphaera sp.]
MVFRSSTTLTLGFLPTARVIVVTMFMFSGNFWKLLQHLLEYYDKFSDVV